MKKSLIIITFMLSTFSNLAFGYTKSDELKCDLNISKYKKFQNAPEEIVQKVIKSTYYVARTDLEYIGNGEIGFEIITYRENVPEKDFGKTNEWEYSNCSNKTVITGECILKRNLDDQEEYRCPTAILFQCTRVPLTKKSLNEYKIDLCTKATECAAEIDDLNDLSKYLKLRDAMCSGI